MGKVNPMLAIVKAEGKFRIQDEDGHIYGFYDTKWEAEESLEGWRIYYNSPLP